MDNNREYIAGRIRELYAIVRELEQRYSGRKFTLDGHLIGSIGEVLVAEYYGLSLLEVGTETHDAIAKDGKLVQIKATQVNRIALSSEPNHLIVIKIYQNGDWDEVYNGPGKAVWIKVGKEQKNGQRPISLAKLRELMKNVTGDQKIQKASAE